MATINYDAESLGRGGSAPAFFVGGVRGKLASGTLDFDSSYPTGGEDIADIFNMFRECKGVVFTTDGTRLFSVDHTNEKVKAFSALGTEVTAATDLSAVTGVRWFAWGI